MSNQTPGGSIERRLLAVPLDGFGDRFGALMDCVGHTNAAPLLGFAAGELLVRGVSFDPAEGFARVDCDYWPLEGRDDLRFCWPLYGPHDFAALAHADELAEPGPDGLPCYSLGPTNNGSPAC